MSTLSKRVVGGFAATAFAGFGSVLAAPAAASDVDIEPLDQDLEDVIEFDHDYVALVDYHCQAPDFQFEETLPLAVGTHVPAAAETGESITVQAAWVPFFMFHGIQEIPADEFESDFDLELTGSAAPNDEATFEMGISEAFTPDPVEWVEALPEWTVEPAELDLVNPGEVAFVPGTITTTVTQDAGTTTTVCEPEGDPEPVTVTEVTGEPVGDGGENGDGENGDGENGGAEDGNGENGADNGDGEAGNGDGNGDAENGGAEDGGAEDGNGEGDEQQAPKDEADDQLPVTGAQLGGLVAAAVAALGGGGAAVYLSRKRKAAAALSQD
ncbi:hypothetical protein RIF23_06305 [Lipingzhangella sp. LS1_29]|uniref:LPXTG cell wall anchor domain-containing protein n=1 Tax=Lipingzhangella rawalii TaxID=2055835 RepID=A0ABU2H4X3_9ACTN|nr:hypothetical protein [Lipingzhangella rawalii]MDS1269904.1 hypothetical protein [Lipingzhangella rawalii]